MVKKVKAFLWTLWLWPSWIGHAEPRTPWAMARLEAGIKMMEEALR